MDVFLVLPPFLYSISTLFWFFLLLISYKKYTSYHDKSPLFSKFSLIIGLIALIAILSNTLLIYQHLSSQNPIPMSWIDWSFVALSNAGAIITAILFTHPSINNSIEEILENEDALNDLTLEKEHFNDTISHKDDFILLQNVSIKIQSMMISATQPSKMLDMITHQFCIDTPFNVAWIGFAERNATALPLSFFHDNAEPRFLHNEFVSALDLNDPYANGPSSQAFLTAKTIVIEDTQSDLRFAQWHSRAKFSQIRSVLAFPLILKEGDYPLGVLTLYSQRSFTYEDPAIALLEAIVQGITTHIDYLNNKIRHDKQALQGLKSLSVLEKIINTIPAQVFWKDRDLRYAGANQNFLASKNITSLPEILGKNDEELGWSVIRPETSIEETKVLHEQHDIINQLSKINNQYFITNKTRYSDQEGRTLGLIGVHIDITNQHNLELDLKRNERRYHEILDSIPDLAIQYFDKDRRITEWNIHNILMFGYSEEEAIGKRVEELLYPEEMRNTFINKVDSWLTQNRPMQPAILELMTKNGQRTKIHTSYVLLDRLGKNPTFISVYLKV
jgi:PAS domain S-box-containing protein